MPQATASTCAGSILIPTTIQACGWCGEKALIQSPHSDGVVVAEGEGLTAAVDARSQRRDGILLRPVSLLQGSPPVYHFDPHNRVSPMATAPYNSRGRCMTSCRASITVTTQFYRRRIAPVAEEDKQNGQLRRFLDLPGGQLDQLYSFARAMLDLYNLEKTDGRLLPLLAQWIGWQTDYRLEIDAQRNEIRNAPHVYKTIGIIPTRRPRLSGFSARKAAPRSLSTTSFSPTARSGCICG